MTTGLKPIVDARSRSYDDPRIQAAWGVLDCGFASVADVFKECCLEALNQFSKSEFASYINAASNIGKLGRGAEPLLAFLEEWPSVVKVAPGDSDGLLIQVMDAINRMQKSPNSKSITPFLQTLSPVAKKLQSTDQIEKYIGIAMDLMAHTSKSIHGQTATMPSPGLPYFFESAPILVGLLSTEGLRRWTEFGSISYATRPEEQALYFRLESPDSRAILLRERSGTLFVDVERQLELYLCALWQVSEQLVPFSTALSEKQGSAPYFDESGMRIPEVYEKHLGLSRTIEGVDRYRALIAHMVGHRRWSSAQIADNLSPFQRLAVECLEDARIDSLLIKTYPGLKEIFLALHPKPLEGACDPTITSCLRHRLAMLSRACIDADHGYIDPNINEFVDRFHESLRSGSASTGEMLKIALDFVTRTRSQSDQLANVFFEDTVVSYHDDNRNLWKFIEDSDDEDFFEDPKKTQNQQEEIVGLPPRHYPEWDFKTQSYRPDWVSLYEALHASGDPGNIDKLLLKHAALAKRLKEILSLLKPQDKVRVRYQEEGTELDLDIALRSFIDFKSGSTPDQRINMSHRPDNRNVDVLLLVDLSQSLNERIGEGSSSQTILELSQEAVALLAMVIDGLGDPLAIAGFHSDTRHQVRYQHIKGFSEGWDVTVKARVAAMEAGFSTRMGAAIRHAGHYLAARKAERRILLVLTDGEPADIDVSDPAYLRADAKRAVEELASMGVSTYCLSMDPQADSYVSEIFGNRWRVLDRIERLPEQLPLLYLNLTR